MTARTLHDYLAASVVKAPPGETIKLASGKETGWYADLRRALLADGRVMGLVADALHARLPDEVEAIGGVPTAGLLLVGPLLMRCHERDDPSRAPRSGFYTRGAAKAHGAGRRVEGHPRGTACLLEDTVTTGGSLVEHAAIAREAGVDVRYALAVLDREEGAGETLLRHGITLLACVRAGEIL